MKSLSCLKHDLWWWVARSAVRYSAVQCSAVQWRAVQREEKYSALYGSAVQCSAVHISEAQFRSVKCRTLQCSSESREGQRSTRQCSALPMWQLETLACLSPLLMGRAVGKYNSLLSRNIISLSFSDFLSGCGWICPVLCLEQLTQICTLHLAIVKCIMVTYSFVQCSAVQCSTVQCSSVPCSTEQYSAM